VLKGVAYHRNLYTRLVSGKESDEIERWFCSEIETPAGKVIEKAVAGDRMCREDWYILARLWRLRMYVLPLE
jgi:hypothetical protein